MSDFNSSLPTRTENHGDVVVRLMDATASGNLLAINSNGSINVSGSSFDIRAIASGTDTIKAAIFGTSGAAVVDAAGSLQIKQKSGDIFSVQLSTNPDISVLNYATATISGGASSTHTYTVTGANFFFNQVLAASAGKFKVEVQVPSGTTKAVFFGTGAAGANVDSVFKNPPKATSGQVVAVIVTNMEKSNVTTDVYSTIVGEDS